ncbi:hypothetical protein ACIRPH_09085 [Nocardiopsis sp. NPDC101807]|uniref:hypothetical protein n=1 Tax=Nocardiopsis sp. NPDC101807 TaxID=3364339 RepID=UPI00380D75E4
MTVVLVRAGVPEAGANRNGVRAHLREEGAVAPDPPGSGTPRPPAGAADPAVGTAALRSLRTSPGP